MDIFSSPAFKIITLLADICVIIFIFSYFIAKNRNRNESINEAGKPETNSAVVYSVENKAVESNAISSEIVAVITAAIMASMQGNGTGLHVKSIKRIGHTTPIWNVAGRNEYILTRL